MRRPIHKKYLFLALTLFTLFVSMDACTIFSAKDEKGQVWAGNNEDGIFSFKWYVNVVTPTDSTFGYVCFAGSNKPGEFIQGGVNDAGLFYDGNSVPPSVYKDFDKKKDFPDGIRAMIAYVLKKCKSVPEVFKLFEVYRLPGNEGGQLHFADKYGNLGIIVADSMWMTKNNYQVSTNYNLCHANKDNINCWRYPIAERILQAKEPGLESFREICDSTSQHKGASTIYSNIHNLATGEMWFFYGMDYNKPYKTSIKEILKKGNRSFYMYELFKDEPLAAVYSTYLSKGVKEGLDQLEEYHLPVRKRDEVLRLLSYDLVACNLDLKSYPFLNAWIGSKNGNDGYLEMINAIVLFCSDKKEEALRIMNNYVKLDPKMGLATLVLNQMKGEFDKKANVKFELNGYANAKYVIVEGLNSLNILYFLVKKDGKWMGTFSLPADEYHYAFVVDGKRILDPKNTDIFKEEGLDNNRIFVKE